MPQDPHRIYHVVVVLGLELTAQGCAEHGARSSDASGGVGTTSSTGGGGATTTLSSAATTTGTGGASTTSTASDGVVLPVPATTGGAGAPAGPEALPCPASQWSCTDPVCRRPTYGDATDCSCDYERPKHEDDCAADENFVCNQYATDDGVEPFGCKCVPSSTECYATCYAVNPWDESHPSSITPDCATRTIFCDCAYPLILK
jgi:hypothetical protein